MYSIPPDNSSRFGWSMAFTKNSVFVSAPADLDSPGKVYECGKQSQKCAAKEILSERGMQKPENGSGFGTILVADESDNIYACAPKTNQPLSRNQKRFMGTCYKLSIGNGIFVNFFELKSTATKGLFNDPLYTLEGPFGMSAVVGDDDGFYVGLPYSQQKQSLPRNQTHVYSGTVVVYSELNRKLEFPSRSNPPPFIFAPSEGRHTLQNLQDIQIGYHVTKGKFTNSDLKEIVIGAPGAVNLKGSVYITKIDLGKYPDTFTGDFVARLNGVNTGEGFGTVAVACDINGDGFDELMVGAPYYAKDYRHYDTGRVHVYINNWNARIPNKINLNKVQTIGDFQANLGAQFGKSLACLGDTDDDGNQELVVGAPFYKTQKDASGAVFIFKNFLNARDEQFPPSQTIIGKTHSFGLSFALPYLKKDTICFTGQCQETENELAISSPLDNRVQIHRFRKVVRFKATTQVLLNCRDGKDCSTFNVDPSSEGLVLTFQPILEAATISDINVKVIVSVGFRVNINGVDGRNIEKETTIKKGRMDPTEFIVVELNPGNRWWNGTEKPDASITIRYKTEYSLPCAGDEGKCNMLPIEADLWEGAKRLNDFSLVTQEEIIKPTMQACDVGNCDCTAIVEFINFIKDRPIVSSSKKEPLQVGSLSMYKTGSDIAHSNIVTLTLSSSNNNISNKIQFESNRMGDRCRVVNQTEVECNLRHVDKNTETGKVILPIYVKLLDFIESSIIYISLLAKSSCKVVRYSSNQTISLAIVNEWKISMKQDSELIVEWDDSSSTEKITSLSTIKQTIEIRNDGPSRSEYSEVLVFVPSGKEYVNNNANISLGNVPCTERGDKRSLAIPPQAILDTRGDRNRIECKIRSDCDPFLCKLEPLDPDTPIELTVTFDFDMKEAAVKGKDFNSIVVGILMVDSNLNEIKGTKVLSYMYNRVTLLELALGKYDYIMGGVFGIVIIIIISLIFKRFDLFNKVRLYKDMDGVADNVGVNDTPIPLDEDVTLRR